MTDKDNGNGSRTLNRWILAMVILSTGGSGTVLLRSPSAESVELIVNRGVEPLEKQVHALELRMTRIEAQLQKKKE